MSRRVARFLSAMAEATELQLFAGGGPGGAGLASGGLAGESAGSGPAGSRS